MTATQAPTPGPLSGDDLWMLVAGDWLLHGNTLVQYIDHGETYTNVREAFVWLLRADDTKYQLKSGNKPWWDELKFYHRDVDGMKVFRPTSARLAPTAPVEASGSGWEQVRDEIEKAFAEGITPQEIIALFRPQGGQQGEAMPPSTRELLDYVGWALDNDAAVNPDHIVALMDAVRSAYRVTTPAQAEAQDEGAAGEPVAWQRRIYSPSGNPSDWQECDPPEDKTNLRPAAIIEFRPLYAHPSPTPAADADRVRIADADAKWLVRWLGDQKEGGHCGEGNVERRERAIWNDRIDRILAALKSTAAKEGGEG